LGKRRPEPPQPVIFLDECVAGEALAKALRARGLRVESHGTLGIIRGTPDLEWIPNVAKNGWVILSKDKFENTGERKIIEAVGAAVFVLRYRDGRTEDIVRIFGQVINNICRGCMTRTRPLLAFVRRSGEIKYEMSERRGGVQRDQAARAAAIPAGGEAAE
jgi:hypothetical protein